MLGSLKALLRSILFGVIILAGLGLVPAPAQAACVCVGAVTQLIGSGQNGSSVCDCLSNKLIGQVTTFPWKFQQGTISGAGQPKSLVDYFENVFWPRWIGMEQKIAQGEALTNAANSHTNVQLLDVQANQNYMMRRDEFKADNAVKTLGRADTACVDPTMASVIYGGGIAAKIESYNLLSAAIDKRDGSSKFPDVANGLVNFYNKMIDARANDLCNPEGNNGMDGESGFCKAPKDGPVVNADVNPGVQYVSPTLSTNKQDKNFIGYAQRMSDNIFSFYFTPLRKEQLQSRTNPINEVLFDRLKFNTQVSNLEQVFTRDIALKKPIDGVDDAVKRAYVEQLKLLGIETDSKGKATSTVGSLFVDTTSGNLSIDSLEELYFKGRNLDPSEMTRVTGASALNLENIALYQTFKVMNSVALLFDIRQEQRLTNRLLATIGSLLAADRHQSIEAKIQAVSSN